MNSLIFLIQILITKMIQYSISKNFEVRITDLIVQN